MGFVIISVPSREHLAVIGHQDGQAEDLDKVINRRAGREGLADGVVCVMLRLPQLQNDPSLLNEQFSVKRRREFGADACEQRRRVFFVEQMRAPDPELIALLTVHQVSILRDPVAMNRTVKQLAGHGLTAEPVPQHRMEQGLRQQTRNIQRSLGLNGA